MTDNTERLAAIEKLGIVYSAEFVSQSRSRNAGKKELTLNWRVTLERSDAKIVTDYQQGIGHLPLYKNIKGLKTSIAADAEYRRAVETGKCALSYEHITPVKLAIPALLDVLYSLTMDSEALDYTFDEWCANYGYDEDSRKAEATYRTCLELAVKLRRMVGDEGLHTLRAIFTDY